MIRFSIRLQLLYWFKAISNRASSFLDRFILREQFKFQNGKLLLKEEKKKVRKEIRAVRRKYLKNEVNHFWLKDDVRNIREILEKNKFFVVDKKSGKKKSSQKDKRSKWEKDLKLMEDVTYLDLEENMRQIIREKREIIKDKDSYLESYTPKEFHVIQAWENDDLQRLSQDQEDAINVFEEEVNWKYLQKHPNEEELESFSKKIQQESMAFLEKNLQSEEFQQLYDRELEKLKKIEWTKKFSIEKELGAKWIPAGEKVNKTSISKSLAYVRERTEREKMYRELDESIAMVDFYDLFSYEAFELLFESFHLIQLMDRPCLTSEILLLALLESPEIEEIVEPLVKKKRIIKKILELPAFVEDKKMKTNILNQLQIVLEEGKLNKKTKNLLKSLKENVEILQCSVEEDLENLKENLDLEVLNIKEKVNLDILKKKLDLNLLKKSWGEFRKNANLQQIRTVFQLISSSIPSKENLSSNIQKIRKKVKKYLRVIDYELDQFDENITLRFLKEIEKFWEDVPPVLIKENFILGEFDYEKLELSKEISEVFSTVVEKTKKVGTPIVSTEMLLLSIMDNKTCNASKVLSSLIPSKADWFLLRFRLLKKLRVEQLAIRSEGVQEYNHRYFTLLLQREINDYQFNRLISTGNLDYAVLLFRNELFAYLYDSFVPKREEEIFNLKFEKSEPTKKYITFSSSTIPLTLGIWVPINFKQQDPDNYLEKFYMSFLKNTMKEYEQIYPVRDLPYHPAKRLRVSWDDKL